MCASAKTIYAGAKTIYAGAKATKAFFIIKYSSC
jgi:hypothetical protein